ncbi:MAG: hypothetical protein IJW21_04350 [Clostridia bacterium]|nr:hypothetical protein [Clostridia bacterium]
MLKNTKFYVALALLVQAVASVVAAIVSAAKKRTFSTIAFFAIGGVSGAAGAYLMGQCIEEEQDFEEYCDGDCENCVEFEECEALEEIEEGEEVAEEEIEEDFALEGGEPFARDAEMKDD